MSVKATHIETVNDLTTPAFVAALHRFTARRGVPHHIYCDQGRNFIGASNHFKRLLSSEEPLLLQYSAENKVEFHFNPPSAPHQGGLWEAAVKSMKGHLKRTVGTTILYLDEFQTLCTRIEGILNSRPLTPLASSPNDMQALTPGHFLVGRPLASLPELSNENEPLPVLRRWKLVEAMIQRIWRRWSTEYLRLLQPRTKWTLLTPPLLPDTLVLIQDPNLPPLKWHLGRVVETFVGSKNQVRVAKVRTGTGELIRPTHRLFPFPSPHIS